MKTHKNLPTFWSLVLRFSAVFILVVMVLEILFELFKNGNLQAITNGFQDNSWISYLLLKLGIGLIYGVFMAYITLKRLKKQQK